MILSTVMVRVFITIFVIIWVLFLPSSIVFAQVNSSSASGRIIEVNGVANLRDRLWERITLFFKFSSSDKVDYEQYLAEKRFAELKYVFDNGKGDMIEETSSRYSSYLGRLTDLIIRNKMVDKKEGVLKMLASHLPFLEELLSKQDYESGFWLLLKHDINYLKLYTDQIKNLN